MDSLYIKRKKNNTGKYSVWAINFEYGFEKGAELKTLSQSMILLAVLANVVFSAEPVKDIYESEASWAEAVKNPRLLKSPAFKYVKTDPKLPRVLLYGDSISIGYTPHVQAWMAGKATVQRIPCNGGDTASGFAKLKQAGMEKGKWDLIHFNWGLHDLKYVDEQGRKVSVDKGKQLRSVEDYKKNLEKLVVILKSSGAKLIFATTTPVGPNNAGRVMGDAKKYNQAAVEVMKKNDIIINDLYRRVHRRLKECQRPNDVHYLPQGNKMLANKVIGYIYYTLYPEELIKSTNSIRRRQCTERLSELGGMALYYPKDHSGWLPVDDAKEPRAHRSLQLLVEYFQQPRDPIIYVCPGSEQVLAKYDTKWGKHFVLTEANVSYAWRARPLKSSAPPKTVLACDKSLDNHNGEGLHVLYLDKSVKWIPKEELGEGGLEAFLKKHHLSR